MGVEPLISTAGITSSVTFIAEREARLRRERQIVAGLGAVTQVLEAPVAERPRLAITSALELAGFGQVAQLISPIFKALDIGRKGLGARQIVKDLILFGAVPPEKVRRIEGFKLNDRRKFAQKVDQWIREITNPGTGQPLIAKFGLNEQDIPRLVETFPFGFGKFGRGEPLRLADGELVLSFKDRRTSPFEIAAFQRQATELRTLAQSRGVL